MAQRIQISDKFTFGRLLRFAVPSIVMVIFTSLYGIVDGLFVSNFAGDDAFAAINLFLPIFYLLGAVGFLLGSGGCALIAKLFGEGNDESARRLFCGLLIIVSGASIVFSAITIPLMPQIATALGAEGEVHEVCVTYGMIMLGGLLPFMLQNFFQYFFAVADRPKFGLAITVGAGLANILGDFLLVYVADMGASGAAIATIASECVGGIIPLIFFCLRGGKKLYFSRPSLGGKTLTKIISNGSSEFLTSASTSIVNMLYNIQLMKYVGNGGVIAFGVIMYVSFVFVGCYLGFSVGTTPIIGYNYGAKNTVELKSVFRKSLLFIGIAAAVMTTLSVSLARPLAMIFVSHDQTLLDLSTTALRIFSVSFIISGFNIYASAFFTALNNGLISAAISMARTLVFQIAAVFVMPLLLGVNGIWSATVFAELLSLVLSIVFLVKFAKRYGYK